MLDLMCWITGTAFTVVYKIAKGVAPFPDDAYTDFLIDADSFWRSRTTGTAGNTKESMGTKAIADLFEPNPEAIVPMNGVISGGVQP